MPQQLQQFEAQDDHSVDMSIVSDDDFSSGPSQQVSNPAIHLSFGSSKDGAWDDRELINAYDAAMEEFHLLNPGPGSWLDKATAALLVGRSLPGATAKTSAWYSASLPTPPAEEAEIKDSDMVGPPPAKRTRKEIRTSNPYSNGGPAPSNGKSKNQRQHSPTFNPPSPSLPDQPPSHFVSADTYDGANWASSQPLARPVGEDVQASVSERPEQSRQPESHESPVTAQDGIYPSPYSLATGGEIISRHHALSYAMNAQYWAGYWMGFARASPQELPALAAMDEPVQLTTRQPSNVVITSRNVGTSGRGTIRR